jgi:uncharacterized membrane protein
MGRSQADVAATALVVVLACAAAASDAPPAAMIVLGIMLLAAPGYLLGQLLVGSRIAGLERVAVMTGLALAVPVLGGLLLYAAGVPLHRPGWLGLLAGVTLAADMALFARRRAAVAGRANRPAAPSGLAAPGEPRAAPGEPRPAWRASRWHVAVFAVAVLVAAGAVGLAAAGTARQPQPGFTQLWLSPQPQGAGALSLGVTNDQGRTTSYRLVLRRDGRVIDTWNLTLGEGRTWQRSVPSTGKQVLAAGLYRLPDLTHPYRYVSVGPGSVGPGSGAGGS